MRSGCTYLLTVGTRRLSSSNQFWTRIISVTGWGFLSSIFTIRNRWQSGHRSHLQMGDPCAYPRCSKRRRVLLWVKAPFLPDIRNPHLIEKIPRHLKLWDLPARPPPPHASQADSGDAGSVGTKLAFNHGGTAVLS